MHFAPFSLSSLVAGSYFFNSNYALLAPKTPLLTAILTFLAMCFMARKGFVYTICSGYLCFSSRILRHFALRLAPKCLAFSTKTHSVLYQMATKKVQMAISSNKNTFCRIHMLILSSIKTNLRENRFFAARWAIGEQRRHS